ncbi:hypothetical protein HPB49_010325 [Dermacentor silvarum]|uniref:Uncharacterized protein n=1 Tax=Dermacentor silvarum TaxID=543639 RepID=A0ACB8E014_DERSI|nr:hypothetical protein HPB49_010325 [Dermacentor silvarum]
MPRLPEDDYKIVLRPKCAVDLANIALVTLLDAIHSTSKIDVEQAEQADRPTNNGRVSNSNSQAQNSTTTRSSRSRQRTQETLRDRSESFPSLQGRSQSRGRSSSRPSGAQHSRPNTQVTWNANKPGHQAKTTQPPNPQVRELAEQVKSLQQALAKANNKIRLLESKPNPKGPLTQNAKEIVATVRRDNEQSNNMEVDNGRAAKRKAESQTVTSEKNAAVPGDRLARIEAAIEKLAQEQARAAEEQTKRLKEIEEMTHHHSLARLSADDFFAGGAERPSKADMVATSMQVEDFDEEVGWKTVSSRRAKKAGRVSPSTRPLSKDATLARGR